MSATNKMLNCDKNLSRTLTETDASQTTTKMNANKLTASRSINTQTNVCKRLHSILLDVLDMLFSCLFVAPCVVAYWRGTWELMGVYIYPNNLILSALVSFAIGGIGHVVFTFAQFQLTEYIDPDKRRLTYYIVSRLYTAIYGVVCVNMWRGSWIACDVLTSADSIVIVTIVTFMALIFMIATRTVRNLASPPFTVAIDHKYDYFNVKTLFDVQGFKQSGLFVLDTIFSVFIIGSLIVLVWRGIWGLTDLVFLTHNRALSCWCSLILGYIIAIVCFAINPIMRYLCNHIKERVIKLLICDIFHILTFWGAVNVWRGVWNLSDIYIFPDNKVLSYWVTTIIPYLLLVLFKCSNSVLVRGVFIDGEGPHGDSLDLQIGFCKTHFEHEREKKQAKEKLDFLLFRKFEHDSHNLLTEKPLEVFETNKSSAIVQNV